MRRCVRWSVPLVAYAWLASASLVALCTACGKKAPDDGAVRPAAASFVAPGAPPPRAAIGGSNAGSPPAGASMPTSPLTAVAWVVEVHDRPSGASGQTGALRAGSSVGMKGAPVPGDGCDGGKWAELEAGGFVCLAPFNAAPGTGGDVATALVKRPDGTRTMPYLYGIVRKPGPIYGRIPTGEEAAATESALEAHVKAWLEAKDETGASFRTDYWTFGEARDPAEAWAKKSSDVIPSFLSAGGISPLLGRSLRRKDAGALVLGQMKRHNGFSFTHTLLRDGRRYAVTPDLQIIPVDRVRPIEGSAFHGVRIPEDVSFPFAFVRTNAAALYRIEGKKLVKDKDIARRTVLSLTGKQRKEGSRLYYETKDGSYISDAHASRLDPAKKMPKWGKQGERWLDVNITKQTLVAYDGKNAVYATLVSTGEAGLEDPKTSKSTTRGIFRVHAKHVASTMDSDVVGEEFELRDIPYVQYFEGSYALHAAYWHDDFGTPRSHGCINLAPEDAKYLFSFTRPEVPPGFHSAQTALTGSVVFVHP